jgi:hypothetical protein
MAHSRKDGAHGGGHRNTRGMEYWKSRLHRGGETRGRFTKRLTHRLERRAAKDETFTMLATEEPKHG